MLKVHIVDSRGVYLETLEVSTKAPARPDAVLAPLPRYGVEELPVWG